MHRVTTNAVADRPAETSARAYSCLHRRRCYATLRWASVPEWHSKDRSHGWKTSSKVVSVSELKQSDVAYVDQVLPLSRLTPEMNEASTYLVAWDGGEPIGHAHIAWARTHLGIPEVQDVFVVPERRRQGIASQLTRAAEDEARTRGWGRISLSVSQAGNEAARRLYTKLGYVEAAVDRVRVSGVIMLRGQPVEVDDTLVYLEKAL
jgi:GNAT superfamily N-acetyltransferase